MKEINDLIKIAKKRREAPIKIGKRVARVIRSDKFLSAIKKISYKDKEGKMVIDFFKIEDIINKLESKVIY